MDTSNENVLKIVKDVFEEISDKEDNNFDDIYGDTYRGKTYLRCVYNARPNFWNETDFSLSANPKINRTINSELDRYIDVLYYYLTEEEEFKDELESLGIHSAKDLYIKYLREEGSYELNNYLDGDFDDGIAMNGELEFWVDIEAIVETEKHGGVLYLESEFTDGYDVTLKNIALPVTIEFNENTDEDDFYNEVLKKVTSIVQSI